MANDFSSDANCVALWRFENGALTTDSKGGNTLTDNNTVGTETTDYKEGAACADLEEGNDEYFSITDTDLDAGFPLKNGDSNKKISVCGWFKLESTINDSAPFAKWDTSPSRRSLIPLRYNGGNWQSYLGYSGGVASELLYQGGSPATGRWYHLGFTFQDSDKAWKLIIWDDTAGAKQVDTSGTATNNINVEDAPLLIGCGFSSSGAATTSTCWDGFLDEVVVFKDILSTDEIDEIRAGTYGSSTPASTPARKRSQVIIISQLWPLLPLAGAIRNNNLTRREFWKPWTWL